ncbi:hypothetical protein Syun_009237 [Stephania yunnanensis]|uniref:Uncharacterized protein n=1 Tax=Stephania yunnanensis TaxID=152371 RepID=A0AAP0KE52_9MAGN
MDSSTGSSVKVVVGVVGCSEARDLQSVARVGDSNYAAFAAFLRPKPPNPFSSRSLLYGSRPAECGARGSATPATPPSRPSCDQNPQIPSRLALSLSGSRHAECGARGSATQTPPRGLRDQNPQIPSRLSLALGSRRSVARVARRLQLRRLRGLPATKTPKSLLVSLSALRLETCGVWRAWLGDSSYAAFAAFLPSQSSWDRSWGPTTPNLGLRLSSSLGFELALRQGRVSLFLRSSSSSSSSLQQPSSVDSLRFEPQFRMYEFSICGYMAMMCISLWRISVLGGDGAQA